jgi:hypothetical protein
VYLKKKVDEWLRQESEEGRAGALSKADYSGDRDEGEDEITRRKMSRDELLAKTVHEQDRPQSVSGVSVDEVTEKRAPVDDREMTMGSEADSNVERAEMAEDLEEKIRHLTEISPQDEEEEEDEDEDEEENDTDEPGHGSTAPLDDDMTGDFDTASYQDKEPEEGMSDNGGEVEPISDNETMTMNDTFVTMDDEDEPT